MRKTLWTLAIVSLAAALAGCGKLKEANDAFKKVSTAVDTAKAMSKSAEGAEKTELTEASVRKFYEAVSKLKKKYPDIEFESSPTAAIQAITAGKSIEKIVPADGGISFDEYNGTSLAILSAMIAGTGAENAAAAIPQLEKSVKDMEAADTSGFTAEQKKDYEKSVADTKKSIEDLKAQAESPEFVEGKRDRDLILEVKGKLGL
jgi:hypothetical protein